MLEFSRPVPVEVVPVPTIGLSQVAWGIYRAVDPDCVILKKRVLFWTLTITWRDLHPVWVWAFGPEE